MARFKRNYLPSQSGPWAKQVEDAIDSTERNLKTVDVNNRSKDEQFAASLSRLDAAARAAAIAAEAAGIAAGDAQDAIDAITGLGNATGSLYNIHGNNITANTITANEISSGYVYAGTIDADKINAGILTGFTIKTAASGQRVEMSSSDIRFYNSGAQTGNIIGSNYSGSNSLSINNTGGVVLIDTQGTYITGGLSVSGQSIFGNVSCGEVIATAGFTTPGGTVSGATVSAGNFSGTTNTSIAGNTTGSFAGNVFINTSGKMFRSTATSSREAKENILSYEFDTDAFIGVNPVTFNYKLDAVQSQEETQINQLGFILEDFEDAGVGEHLVIPANEVDKYKGLRYDKLYMMLHKVVQAQDETIKSLTARIEALESN